MVQEVTMRINGASTNISHTGNNAEVGGTTGDIYDMHVEKVERVQEGYVDAPQAPNIYQDAYMAVHNLGYSNPIYNISGRIDELMAEQLLQENANAAQKVVHVADGTKFTTDQDVYIWDDSDGERNTISSISGNNLTMENNLANNYTTSADGRVRARDVIGQRILQYFLETSADKVLVDELFLPDGICIQINNVSIVRNVTSISSSSGQPEDIQSLTANAASGQANVTVADGSVFSTSEIVYVYDGNNTERHIILNIAGNVLTMTANLAKSYATARGAAVSSGESIIQGAVANYNMQVVMTNTAVSGP